MRIKLGYKMTLSEISSVLNSTCPCEKSIGYITTDSREVKSGDLFVALRGENYNGEDYVEEAIAKGAIALCTRKRKGAIVVHNTTDALLDLAAYYKKGLKRLKYSVAITGSVGKTTTKEFLKQISSVKYKTHATIGNMNNHIGMPLSVLSAPMDTEAIILEMGMNNLGEISKMSGCIKPDIAIITNIGTSHIGNLGSRKNIAKAKLEITEGQADGSLIVPYGEDLLKGAKAKRFSTSDISADYYLQSKDKDNISLYENGRCAFTSNFSFTDQHLLTCLAAAIAAAREMRLTEAETVNGILLISKDNIRQKIIRAKNIYFLEDCYNSSIESVKADIDVMNGLVGYSAKSLLLGDILELGEHSEKIHEEIGRMISQSDFKNLYLYGNHARYIMSGAVDAGFPESRIFGNFSDDISISARQLIDNTSENEIILLKASRKMRLERIIEIVKATD